MKIAALDSSGLVASVAVAEDDVLIAEYSIQYKKTHSQTLLPMLEAVKSMVELDLDSLDAIAVAAGPGSFTGLRIGSATAKGMGLALGKPVIGIPTVDGLAYRLYGTDKLVCPLMDARRGQVYTGIYEFRRKESSQETFLEPAYELFAICPQSVVSIEEITDKLNGLGREAIFTGDGIPVFAQRLRELLSIPYSFAPVQCNRQSAAAIAALAQEYYRRGEVETAAEHRPEYLRLSQAERERQQPC